MRRRGRGWVFTPADFADLGTRDAVASALKRYKAAGTIRSLARGLYDYPIHDAVIGVVAPSTSAVVAAVTRRHGIRILPHGAQAANALGLSLQVPMRTVLLTDGPSRLISVMGRRIIRFKHAAPRLFATAGRRSGLVFQALRYLGPDSIDDQVMQQLVRRLSAADWDHVRQDLHLAPAWMAKLLRPIVGEAA